MRTARLTSRAVGSADSAARPLARRAPSRRGIVCVIAMLFLVLFVIPAAALRR
jgi:hypothetical protein